MKIIETEVMVDEQGKFIIPDCIIEKMGLEKDDTVRLAFMSNSDDNMIEFCIVSDDHEKTDISLSHELLEAANIPLDSDIEIACTEGAIIIKASELLTIPCELCQLFAELGISPETVRNGIKNKIGGM